MDVTSYLLGKQAGGGSAPTLQSKSVTITENGTTNVTADAGYDGLSNVGITTNVQPDLETLQETITTNGTTTYTPSQDKDGFSSVEITTNVSGGGTDEYFNNNINQSTADSFSSSYQSLSYLVKKLPPLTINSDRCSYLFRNVNIKRIENLTFLKDVYFTNNMFQGCTNTAVIDISSLDTSNISASQSMFQNCGTYCLQSDGAYADGIPYVYVKDAAAQSFVLSTGNVPSTWSTNNVVIKSS